MTTLRPIKLYDNLSYHLFDKSFRMGPIRWTGRTPDKLLEVPPIPEEMTNRRGVRDGYGYDEVEPSIENMRKMFPREMSKGLKYKMEDFHLIFCIQCQRGETTKIKGALKNISTGEIVLLTGSSTKPEDSSVPSIEDGWFSYKADMAAPPIFWDLLRHHMMEEGDY